jgi:hypothetical protein
MRPHTITPVHPAQLEDRRYTIERALDEVAVVQETRNIDDLAPVLGLLEAYRPANQPHRLPAAVSRIDEYIREAKAYCWQLMNQPPAALTAEQLTHVCQFLETALSWLLPLMHPC